MSIKYQKCDEVPTQEIIGRLNELGAAFPNKEDRDREFTMRIPAELDRDPDVVLFVAAQRMDKMRKALQGFMDHLPPLYGDEVREGVLEVAITEDVIFAIEEALK